MISPSLRRVSETHAMIYLGEEIKLENTGFIAAISEKIRLGFGEEITEVVPSYTSIMIEFNLLKTQYSAIESRLQNLLETMDKESVKHTSALIELPVFYHQEVAPDLATLAQAKQMSVEQVIEIHCQTEYQVCAIGFAPGFAFLGSVDDKIAMPRHTSPRVKIPGGSVGIADKQTAVYPDDSPGGWQIIGNCPVKLFDPECDPMMPLSVGDKVLFKPMSRQAFIKQGGQIWPSWK